MIVIPDCIYHFINGKNTGFCQIRILVSQIVLRTRSHCFSPSLILKHLKAVKGGRVSSPGFILIMKEQICRIHLLLPISSIFKWSLFKFHHMWVHFRLFTHESLSELGQGSISSIIKWYILLLKLPSFLFVDSNYSIHLNNCFKFLQIHIKSIYFLKSEIHYLHWLQPFQECMFHVK